MDETNLVITILLGFIVLLFYSLLLPSNKYVYGNIQNKNLLLFYFISIILSGISYIIIWILQVFFYQEEHNDNNSNSLYTTGNALFLLGALLWPFFLYLYPKQFHLVIFTLCITSLGSLLILIQECLYKDNIVGIIFAIYLFFHVFILDNIIWSSSYRKLFS